MRLISTCFLKYFETSSKWIYSFLVVPHSIRSDIGSNWHYYFKKILMSSRWPLKFVAATNSLDSTEVEISLTINVWYVHTYVYAKWHWNPLNPVYIQKHINKNRRTYLPLMLWWLAFNVQRSEIFIRFDSTLFLYNAYYFQSVYNICMIKASSFFLKLFNSYTLLWWRSYWPPSITLWNGERKRMNFSICLLKSVFMARQAKKKSYYVTSHWYQVRVVMDERTFTETTLMSIKKKFSHHQRSILLLKLSNSKHCLFYCGEPIIIL